uniref:Small ribosomal subunit protein uS17 n=1 Tax=Salmo salar TaxID=8030 RepID=B5XD95_SALSA|nr:40S ribosomal protein S11 [Salmo salar]
MADAQTERAYQKQPTIFQNKKRVLVGEGGKEAKEKLPRYHKSVGLGFKTPREAIDGTYIDKKCPFTGNVSIRGRILSGVVTKMKMQRTIVIRRDYLHYIRKYNRFEKRPRTCRSISHLPSETSLSETLLPSESADPSARQ